jgi:hypothetical protein
VRAFWDIPPWWRKQYRTSETFVYFNDGAISQIALVLMFATVRTLNRPIYCLFWLKLRLQTIQGQLPYRSRLNESKTVLRMEEQACRCHCRTERLALWRGSCCIVEVRLVHKAACSSLHRNRTDGIHLKQVTVWLTDEHFTRCVRLCRLFSKPHAWYQWEQYAQLMWSGLTPLSLLDGDITKRTSTILFSNTDFEYFS